VLSQRLCRSLATEATNHPPIIRSKRPRTEVTAAVVLNRAPILTRTPTLFERAYYAYQARIRRALHSPFPLDFYFKQGSLLESKFSSEERTRERRAFGPKFNLEDVTNEKSKAAVAQLAQQGEGLGTILPRLHETDVTRDTKSLDRNGRRNLYLLLLATTSNERAWRFPQGSIEKGELLHQAAQRDLYAECGENMDMWIVSRNPIGVYKKLPSSDFSSPEARAEKITFFFKGHIMAGQVKPNPNTIADFAWLTKQEIKARVEKDYWESVKDMLSED